MLKTYKKRQKIEKQSKITTLEFHNLMNISTTE